MCTRLVIITLCTLVALFCTVGTNIVRCESTKPIANFNQFIGTWNGNFSLSVLSVPIDYINMARNNDQYLFYYYDYKINRVDLRTNTVKVMFSTNFEAGAHYMSYVTASFYVEENFDIYYIDTRSDACKLTYNQATDSYSKSVLKVMPSGQSDFYWLSITRNPLNGDIFLGNTYAKAIYKLTTSGSFTIYIGGGTDSGSGVSVSQASIVNPGHMVFNRNTGDLYYLDSTKLKKVVNDTVYTVIDTGVISFSFDNDDNMFYSTNSHVAKRDKYGTVTVLSSMSSATKIPTNTSPVQLISYSLIAKFLVVRSDFVFALESNRVVMINSTTLQARSIIGTGKANDVIPATKFVITSTFSSGGVYTDTSGAVSGDIASAGDVFVLHSESSTLSRLSPKTGLSVIVASTTGYTTNNSLVSEFGIYSYVMHVGARDIYFYDYFKRSILKWYLVTNRVSYVTKEGQTPTTKVVDGAVAADSTVAASALFHLKTTGELFFLDTISPISLRKISTSGKLVTVLGGGNQEIKTGGVATSAMLTSTIGDIYVTESNIIYFAGEKLLRIENGIIRVMSTNFTQFLNLAVIEKGNNLNDVYASNFKIDELFMLKVYDTPLSSQITLYNITYCVYSSCSDIVREGQVDLFSSQSFSGASKLFGASGTNTLYVMTNKKIYTLEVNECPSGSALVNGLCEICGNGTVPNSSRTKCVNQCFGVYSDSSSVCSSHGYCNESNSCVCNVNWFADDCSTTNCYGISSNDPTVCGQHGKCSSFNGCTCDSGYTGMDCKLLQISNKDIQLRFNTDQVLVNSTKVLLSLTISNDIIKAFYANSSLQYNITFQSSEFNINGKVIVSTGIVADNTITEIGPFYSVGSISATVVVTDVASSVKVSQTVVSTSELKVVQPASQSGRLNSSPDRFTFSALLIGVISIVLFNFL